MAPAIRFALIASSLYFGAFAGSLCAQPCYATYRRDGIAMVEKKNYADAMNQFWAAMITCSDRPEKNDLSDLIKNAQQQWINDLEASVRREKKAHEEALKAKELAENAKQAEEKARLEAEANAKKAREQGIRAEALRLALLADLVRQQGRKSDAVLLAWMALQLSGPELSPFAQRTFGEAVRDSFSIPLFKNPASLEALRMLPGTAGLLLKTSEPAWYKIHLDETTSPKVVKFSPEYIGVAPSGNNRQFVVWDNVSNAQLTDAEGHALAALRGHTEPVRAAVFSPDDQLILTCSRDNTARLWDLQGRPVATLSGHTGNVYTGCFSPGGRQILTRSSDGSARLWALDGSPLAVLQFENEFVVDAAFNASGDKIITLSAAGIARLWAPDGKMFSQLNAGKPGAVQAILTTANGDFLLRTDRGEISRFAANGEFLCSMQHGSPVLGMAVSPDGTMCLSWGADRVIRVWNQQGTLVRTIEGHRGEITDAVFSKNLRYILSTAKDGVSRLWNIDGSLISEWALGSSTLPNCFTPDGRQIIAVTANGPSVSRSPLPAEIYQSMGLQSVLQSDHLRQLVQEYNVQFYEALSGK